MAVIPAPLAYGARGADRLGPKEAHVSILVPLLICVAAVVLLVGLIALPGLVITRRRAARARVAVESSDTTGLVIDRGRPLDPTEVPLYRATVDFAAAVREAGIKHVGAIEAALREFTSEHEIAGILAPQVQVPKHQAVTVDFPEEARPLWAGTEIALRRMRLGVREPAWAPRTTEAETGTWSMRGLRELLALEEASASR